jgi:[protein-PII] uridylyltransferase
VLLMTGGTPPHALEPTAAQLALVRHGGGAVRIVSARVAPGHGPVPLQVTIAAPDRPGLLWQAAGVLALHRLAVRTARSHAPHPGSTAVLEFTALPEFGSPPDPATLEADLRRVLASRLDVAARLERRAVRGRRGITVPPPRVTIVGAASATATVVEVRAHDRPGLLWRIGHTLGECGLQVRTAKVDTLGANAVDVFYVLDDHGLPVTDSGRLAGIREHVLAALR